MPKNNNSLRRLHGLEFTIHRSLSCLLYLSDTSMVHTILILSPIKFRYSRTLYQRHAAPLLLLVTSLVYHATGWIDSAFGGLLQRSYCYCEAPP